MKTPYKYIVTDPCYILSDEKWAECCKVYDTEEENEATYQRFNDAVAQALTELTGSPAYACDTGFGDWNNEISGITVIHEKFCADSGMVCVCRLTKGIEEHLAKKYTNFYSYSGAIFEGSDNIEVTFDVSDKSWTVVKIDDCENRIHIESSSNDDYDDEDDYEAEEEYEEEYEDD